MLATEPPIAAEAPAEEQPDVIEVIGARANETVKVDRRTYQVQQTPHSAQKDGVQLLRGLPSVTVTPDDRILLLGAGNAKIYVDGRPYVGDARQYLRTLHGSDIARIEVMTNPSAQFSSEGTGGVINVVLRKNEAAGLTGNASYEASTYGYGLVDTTLNYKTGKWAYEVKGGGNVGTMSRSTYQRQRSVETAPGSAPTVNSEDGLFTYDGTVGRLNGKVTYELDPKTTLSARLGGGGGHDVAVDKAEYRGLTPDFASFSEKRQLNSFASYLTAELSMDHQGAREGEALTAAAQFYKNPQVRDVTDARFSDGRFYRSVLRHPTYSVDTQADWKHPMGEGQILSIGSTWHVDGTSQDYRFTSDGSFGPDAWDGFDGRSSTLAAYATFQQSFGKFTLVPGLRGEYNRRRISGSGLTNTGTEADIDRTNVFPTFHLKYQFSRTLEFGASYSKRIDRVPLENLRPYGLFEDAVTVFEGNPGLKDQSTDAYELSLSFHPGKIQANVVAYMRRTTDLWSKMYSVNSSGTTVYSYVNAGVRRDSGAQFDLSTPIFRGVKATASLNLFDQRSPVDTVDGPQDQRNFTYTTNGTLEWSRKDRNNVPGDVAQLQWSYNGPSKDYQTRNSAWSDVSLSYTHSFNRTLSLSGTFRSPGRTEQQREAPALQETYTRKRTPEFQLKLLKTLGKR